MVEGIFYAKAAASLAAAIAVSVGVLGPSIGQGLIGAKAVENIGKYPESASKIQGLMFGAMILVETAAIYSVLVAGWLLATR